jgi:uncharacterized protein (DUF305 family)
MRPAQASAIVLIVLMSVRFIVGDETARADEDEAPLYTATDLRFLQHMIVHHQQAVEMSALVAERTDREAFVRYANYIGRGQQAEIAVMESLLELAAERGVEIPASHEQSDPPMRGMLSRAQMEALAASAGPAFERLWLEGMIQHHEGALEMARAQQLAQLRDGRRPHGIDVLVEEIVEDQRAEIAQMRRWLETDA